MGAGPVEKDPWRGFAGPHPAASFAISVREACRPGGVVDRRLIEGGLLQSGSLRAAPTNYRQSSGAEGAEVPPAMRQGIWQIVHDDPLMALFDIEPTSSPVVDMIADESTPWGASGIKAYWRSRALSEPRGDGDRHHHQRSAAVGAEPALAVPLAEGPMIAAGRREDWEGWGSVASSWP